MASVVNIGELSQKYNVPDGYADWRKDVAEYVEKKKTFQGVAEPYHKVTHKFIKDHDALYNPVNQIYSNPETEKTVQRVEQQNMIDVLAGNRDRALRYEQTYNVLTFDNKLKGLEHRDNYPKEKPWYFRPGKDSSADYNISSNYPMTEHHFQPPGEKRPGPDPDVRTSGCFTRRLEIEEVQLQGTCARLQHRQQQVHQRQRSQSGYKR